MYGHDDAAADASGGQGAIEGATGGEKMGVSLIPTSDQDHLAEAMDAAAPLMSVTSNQLTLLFQGEVYVFDSVSPEKVCSNYSIFVTLEESVLNLVKGGLFTF